MALEGLRGRAFTLAPEPPGSGAWASGPDKPETANEGSTDMHDLGDTLDSRRDYLDETLPEGWSDPDHLEELPTLSSAQADDLKIDDGDYRVWLSRVTDEGVTVEELRRGKWRNYWSNHEEVDPS